MSAFDEIELTEEEYILEVGEFIGANENDCSNG